MDEQTVDVSGLRSEAVLVALYERAQPQGLGFLHYDPAPMSEEEATELLLIATDDEGLQRFDYLKGRVMKVRLGGESFDPRLYDRDNGPGAAASAIEGLRGRLAGAPST